MDEFGVFKGLFNKANRLEEIAAMKGIKGEIKELIRTEAKEIRELANGIESPKIVLTEATFQGCECKAPE